MQRTRVRSWEVRAEEDLLSLHRGIYHPGSLITMDSPIVRPPANSDPQISRREILGAIKNRKTRDYVIATSVTLFMVSATTAQATLLAIILYLMGVI